MNWTQLFERGGLPDGFTAAEALALDRSTRGEKLGPAARRSVRKGLRKLEQERRLRATTPWDYVDEMLKQEWTRTGSPAGTARSALAPSTSPARPGAVPSAPRSPAAGGDGLSGAAGALRRGSFNGRTATRAELEAECTRRGWDTALLGENRPSSPAELKREHEAMGTSAQQRLLDDAHRRAVERRSAARAERLKAGAINAMDPSTSPEQVQARIQQLLGPSADRDVAVSFKPAAGEPLKPLPRPEDRFAEAAKAAAEARAKAERAAKQLAKQSRAGKPVNSKTMAPDIFEAYLKARGYWAGGIL